MAFRRAHTAGTPPGYRARWRWSRLPSDDRPDVCPCRRVVGDPVKPPAQLDCRRQLALLLADSADRGGVGLGDDEHPKRMAIQIGIGKRRLPFRGYAIERAE